MRQWEASRLAGTPPSPSLPSVGPLLPDTFHCFLRAGKYRHVAPGGASPGACHLGQQGQTTFPALLEFLLTLLSSPILGGAAAFLCTEHSASWWDMWAKHHHPGQQVLNTSEPGTMLNTSHAALTTCLGLWHVCFILCPSTLSAVIFLKNFYCCSITVVCIFSP